MKIIADQAIPFLKGVLEPWAEMRYLNGSQISKDDVRDADALIIRTRTRCDATLLEHSSVRMIATATIGFDHIDLAWCHAHGIKVVTAAGCNARGVLQWVAGVLVALARKDGWQPHERTLGIIGVGHVGSLVKQYAEAWGFRVVCCDPPRQAKEHLDFLELDEVVRQADILTFHTPLDASTHHLVDAALLEKMPKKSIILNSSRGAVVDNTALAASSHRYALDVWEQEPNLNPTLLKNAEVATPHIAGYSEQGKANATSMAVGAIARFFDITLHDWYPTQAARQTPCAISWAELNDKIDRYFDVESETQCLKQHPDRFELIRDQYAYRREFF